MQRAVSRSPLHNELLTRDTSVFGAAAAVAAPQAAGNLRYGTPAPHCAFLASQRAAHSPRRRSCCEQAAVGRGADGALALDVAARARHLRSSVEVGP